MIHLLFFTFTTFRVLASSCGFKSDDIVTYKDAKECLESIPLSKEISEKFRTIKSLQVYLTSDAFYSYYQGVPAPYGDKSIDLSEQLSTLNAQEFTNTNEFYSAISDVVRKAGNPNLLFTKPCGWNFAFVLPLGISAGFDSTTKSIKLFFSQLPSEFQRVTTAASTSYDYTKLIGCEITAISENLKDSELKMKPVEYLSQWAKNNVFISRDDAVNFNRAIQNDFSIRFQETAGIPPQNRTKFNFIDDKGREMTIDLPWMSVVFDDIKKDSLETLCPLTEASNQKNSLLKPRKTLRQRITNDDTAYVTAKLMSYQGKKIGYLRIRTFDVEGASLQLFVQQLIAAMKSIKTFSATSFILDMRENFGGKPGLSLFSLRYIFGNRYPIFPEMVMPKSNLHTELNKHNILTQTPHYEYTKSTNITKSWYKNTVKKTVKTTSGQDVSFDYTKRYTVSQFAGEGTKSDVEFYKLLDCDSPILFAPEDTLILTDGLCLGACALFIKKLENAKLGRIIALGKTDTDSFAIGSGVAGQTMSSTYIEQLPSTYPNLTFNLPLPFPRSDTSVSWPSEAVYSYDWTARKNGANGADFLEFTNEAADIRLSHFPSFDEFSKTSIESTIKSLSRYFDVCSPWNVKISSKCKKGSEKSDPKYKLSNALYGFPCDSTSFTFDESKCAFAQCSPGYYLSSRNKCESIPKLSSSLSAAEILVPIIILLIVAVLIVVAFFGFRRYRQKQALKFAKINEYQAIQDVPEDTSVMDTDDE